MQSPQRKLPLKLVIIFKLSVLCYIARQYSYRIAGNFRDAPEETLLVFILADAISERKPNMILTSKLAVFILVVNEPFTKIFALPLSPLLL